MDLDLSSALRDPDATGEGLQIPLVHHPILAPTERAGAPRRLDGAGAGLLSMRSYLPAAKWLTQAPWLA